jgi:hypothetical protein
MENIFLNSLIVGGLALFGALIGSLITPLIVHKFNLKRIEKEHLQRINYKEREIKFNWKKEEFEKISEIIDDKLFVYREINQKIIKREFSKKELLDKIDATYFKKIPKPKFLFEKTNQEFLKFLIKFIMYESTIAIFIKDSLKKNKKIDGIDLSEKLTPLNTNGFNLIEIMKRGLKL